jgi:DNA polymerase
MFIGEGPGYDEDHTGIVFIGRAGKLLDKLLENEAGLKRSGVYIANIVKCHPMKDPSRPHMKGNDRPPQPEETASCMDYLIKQIKIIKPNLIVTLGSPSSKTMLETESGITGIRGNVYEREIGGLRLKLMPTYHPAYILRNPAKNGEIVEDFRKIRKLL